MDKSALIQEQSWPPRGGQVIYRVTLRDVRSKENIGVLRNIEEPRCVLPADWLRHPEDMAMRVEVQEFGKDEWTTWVPFFMLGEIDSPVQWIKTTENAGKFPVRMIVRYADRDDILLDEARFGDFPLPEDLAPRGANLRYRFLRYDHAEKRWVDLGGYTSFIYCPIERFIHSEDQSQSSLRYGTRPRPYLFTIDVEVNMRYQRMPDPATVVNEHVFGVTPRGGPTGYGIHYIMDALDARGMKGTFFVDVLMEHQVGENGTRRTIDAILSRGHDVQLHMHPNPNLYFSDSPTLRALGLNFARHRDVDSFRGAMDLAVESYLRFTGMQPIAFRSGSYIFRDEFFPVLKEFGIQVDSSIYAFKNFHASGWMRTRTTPFIHSSGILEVPITWMQTEIMGKSNVLQHTLKLGSQAGQVLTGMQEFWRRYPLPQVTLIHSYSLLKELKDASDEARQAWNGGLASLLSEELYKTCHLGNSTTKTTMDGAYLERIHSLNSLLDTLASDETIRTYTFSEIAGMDRQYLVLDSAVDPVIRYDVSAGLAEEIGLQRYSSSYLQHLDVEGCRGEY